MQHPLKFDKRFTSSGSMVKVIQFHTSGVDRLKRCRYANTGFAT